MKVERRINEEILSLLEIRKIITVSPIAGGKPSRFAKGGTTGAFGSFARVVAAGLLLWLAVGTAAGAGADTPPQSAPRAANTKPANAEPARRGPLVPGVEVILKHKAEPPQIAGHAVIDVATYRRFKIERVEKEQLWLISAGIGGWVREGDVMLFERAVEELGAVIVANPGAAWAYNHRAMVLIDKQEPDKAMADFEAAIRLDPHRASLYNNRAAVWVQKKVFDRAIVDYTEAIKLDPENALAYHGRGLTRLIQGDVDGAISDSTEALRLNPKIGAAFLNRGLAWHEKGRWEQAISDFNEAIRLNPEDPVAYNDRGFTREIQKDLARALTSYNEALRLDPSYVKAHLNRARIRGAKQDHIGALADFNEAVRLDPRNVRAHQRRAWLQATCPDATVRNGKAAVEDATRACDLTAWKDPVCLAAFAAALAEAGDFATAIKWQTEVLHRVPAASGEAASYRTLLALYQAGKPYRQEPTSP